MKKRLISALMAVMLVASLLSLPAHAANTATVRFSDIADNETAVSVESLRLMGVLDGYQDGNFRPNAVLTRAQFCKMAVYAMNASDELGKYEATTVFPDVKPSHWASAYINLASKGKSVILGFADGKFHPDSTITAAQAVTILTRLLGYKDEDVGAVWPNGYLAQAKMAGLLDNLTVTASAPLTRGQAARLFANLLRCDNKEGSEYASTIASSVVKNTMLVSSTATAADGTDTALKLSNGTTYQIAGKKVSNGLLNGRMGTLLIDKNGKAMTFVPEMAGSTKTVVVSEATNVLLTDNRGDKYAMTGDIAAYYDNEQKQWSEVYSWLTPGTTVTLYLGSSGGVEYVFVGSGSTASQAVIVYSQGSTVGLNALAGGSTNYTFLKNGAAATAGDLRPYDVVTYSGATNSMRVCDVRLTGVYEACSPNPTAPTEITVLGHTFPVLTSAQPMLAQLKVGKVITLLLTDDNQVAGAVDAEGSNVPVRGNAVGIVSVGDKKASVKLLCGLTLTGSISNSNISTLDGQLVKVSSNQKGSMIVNLLSGGVTGDLDITNRMLGKKMLAENVVIYQNDGSKLTVVALNDLGNAMISRNQISYAGTDWAGRVNLLVLNNGHADGWYYYGRAKVGTTKIEYKKDDNVTGTMERQTLTVICGENKTVGPLIWTGFVTNNSYVRVRVNKTQTEIESVDELTRLTKVPNSAWSGMDAVTVNGRTYRVASDVICYNKSSESWVSLSVAHSYANVSDLYADNSGVIRVVEVS